MRPDEASTTAFELQHPYPDDTPRGTSPERRDAWLFLAACFMIEALVWAATHAPFADTGSVAVIGTCAMGIMYLDTPLIMYLHRRFPKPARYSTILGLLTMCLALALSSFSTTVTHLIITQGVFYALGGSVAYASCIIYLEEWFVARRGLAFGIIWSATGLAGVVLPLVLEYLFQAKGYQTTLRVFAGVVFGLTAPLAWFVKPRLPVARVGSARRVELGFVVRRPFVLFQVFNVLEAVGFFLPGIYLPSYARAMIDRLEVTRCLLVSTGLSVNLPVLYLFTVVYRLFAGAYTSAWPGIMKVITGRGSDGGGSGHGKAADPSMVFAFLAMGRGVGNVISGPLSEVLVSGMPWKGQAFGGYGSGYGGLIAFTGASALLGGGSYVWKRLGWM
ncbi:monocarboxylate transporter 10 [Chaetomidium leptoderma]|uniref:Monocarboxylate transporter 10 n=1 Tax=Chaetomidium leptoderma TaxID=669021 RepID=A0AAN6ZRU2_9PEZI|nr:monocarboxylate transporter 10 [Chaetomidium leptoderma]